MNDGGQLPEGVGVLSGGVILFNKNFKTAQRTWFKHTPYYMTLLCRFGRPKLQREKEKENNMYSIIICRPPIQKRKLRITTLGEVAHTFESKHNLFF